MSVSDLRLITQRLNRKSIRDYVNQLCDDSLDSKRIPVRAFGLHVTSLNSSQVLAKYIDENITTYADGYSVVIAARKLHGGTFPRFATTDLFPQVLQGLAFRLERSPRIAIIGADIQTARQAALTIESKFCANVVFVSDGFQSNWEEVTSNLNLAEPDLLLVGMGMPIEAIWTTTYSKSINCRLILTCGGMLRLLAGTELRSPKVLINLKLEWLYRIVTNPKRTLKRYLIGASTLIRVCFSRKGRT